MVIGREDVFQKMPAMYQKTLAYADTIRHTLSSIRDDAELLEAVLEYLKRQKKLN